MHLPALLAAMLTFVLAIGLFVSGLIADGISTSHRLLEEVLYHAKHVEHDLLAPTSLTGELGGAQIFDVSPVPETVRVAR